MMKTVTLLLVTCVAFASAVFAAPHHRGGDRDPGTHFLEVMADRLGLTAEQEERITGLVNEARLESAVDRERVAQLRQALQTLSQSPDTFDEGAARTLADELGQVVTRMAVAGAQTRWQVYQQLTEEQREQVNAWHGGRTPHPPPMAF
jgi:Spy/CpxP family protein refolding chaperone